MKPPEQDAAHLWDMLEAGRQARELSVGIDLDGLLNDLRTRYAVERALEIIGEAARRVSESTQARHPEIPWAGIIAFRNVLAQEYGAIDNQRLYAVLRDDLPGLIANLEAILSSLER